MVALFLTAIALVLAYLRALVSAQDDVTIIGTTLPQTTTTSKDVSAATGGSRTSTTRTPATMTITVNRVQNLFVPENITAQVGDIVKFEFWPTNNSVARSELGYPCVPYALTGGSKSGLGFWSGFKPIVANLAQVNISELPAFYMVINRVTPLFFYNSAPGACIDHQMVGVINPADPSQLSVQKRAAAAATLALSPGEALPQGSSISSFNAATATSSSAASSSSSPTKASVSSGAIAGIVIGVLACCALVGMAIWSLRRLRKRRAHKDKNNNSNDNLSPTSEPDLTSLGTTPRSPLTPRTAVSELPGSTIDGVLVDGGRAWSRPGSEGGGYVVSPPPPWTPDGRGAAEGMFEPWQEGRGGQGGLRVMSELSAYGEVRKDQVPSSPPDKRLPVLPEEQEKQKGPYELGS